MTRTRSGLAAALAALLAGAGVSGCVGFGRSGPDVSVVTDLSGVAGCRFLGTVRPPAAEAGLRDVGGYAAYLDELKRRTAGLGGTHLYRLNEAAGWGAASAYGTAYRCVVP